jgi:hypothetical protein
MRDSSLSPDSAYSVVDDDGVMIFSSHQPSNVCQNAQNATRLEDKGGTLGLLVTTVEKERSVCD